MSRYYDRQGKPISMLDAAERHDAEYRVASTDVNGYWVSTVWLGLDHRIAELGWPLIFETMIFSGSEDAVSDWVECCCRRYSTEDEAKAGHAAIVAALVAGADPGDLS